MQSLSERLIRFVEHVKEVQKASRQTLKILDLRLECRNQRLTEYPDWPLSELELIEQEAVGYGDDAELSRVLAGEVGPRTNQPNAWLDSPSPFAWT